MRVGDTPPPGRIHESRRERSERKSSCEVPVNAMGCIYRILCHATGRSYIGQTAYSNPFQRFIEHRVNAGNGVAAPLYDDMRAYGMHAFECICIRVCSNEELNALECYYAEQYNAYVWDGGYNLGECGKAPVRADVSDSKRLWMKRMAIRRAR